MSAKVVVRYFDAAEMLIAEHTYPLGKWYEGLHPIMDEDNHVRERYGVRLLAGEQISASGSVVARWFIYYAADGSLISIKEWDSNEPEGQWHEILISPQ